MAVSVTHQKVNNIPDPTQADVDAQIALGNLPAGTVLADLTLHSDWNAAHTVTGAIASDGTTTTTGIIPFGSFGLSTDKITNLAGGGNGLVAVNNAGTISKDTSAYLTATTGDLLYIQLDGGSTTTGTIHFGTFGLTSEFIAFDTGFNNGIVQNTANQDIQFNINGAQAFSLNISTGHESNFDIKFPSGKGVKFGSLSSPTSSIIDSGVGLVFNSRVSGTASSIFPYDIKAAQTGDVFSVFGIAGTSTVITPSDATDRLVSWKVDTSTATAARRAAAFLVEGGATSASTARLIGANNIAAINSSATGNYTSTTNGGGVSGMRGIAANESTTTVVSLGTGVTGKVQGKTFTEAVSFFAELPTVDSTYTWTDFSQMRMKFTNPAGTITNAYGLRIDSIGSAFATTSYQIALDGVGARSGFYFNTPSAAGVDYIRDVSAGNLIANAATSVAVGIGGTAQATITSGVASFITDIKMTTAGNKLFIKEGTNGSLGQATLVSGTVAVTISGVSTASRAFAQMETPGGTLGTGGYKAVCTSNTLTITSISTAGALNVLDTSTLNYVIIQPA